MKLGHMLLQNYRLKLAAFLLALVSWHAIRQTISFEATIADIPIEIQVDTGWSVLQQSTDTVSVTFRGAQEDIRLMDHKQLRAVVRIDTSLSAPTEYVALSPQNITGARGLRVLRLTPERLQVTLDREAQKKVPVKARVTGRPLAGEVESLTCEPAIVLLRGPERQLAQTDLLYTETVDLEGRQSSFKKRCRIMPPSNVWTPHIDPPEVHVAITIVQQTDSHVWNDVPVLALVEPGLPAQTILTPARVTITLTGRSEALKNIQQLTPRAFVDCIGLDPSLTYELPVRVHLPPGTPVTAAVDPPAVHIVINQTPKQPQEL